MCGQLHSHHRTVLAKYCHCLTLIVPYCTGNRPSTSSELLQKTQQLCHDVCKKNQFPHVYLISRCSLLSVKSCTALSAQKDPGHFWSPTCKGHQEMNFWFPSHCRSTRHTQGGCDGCLLLLRCRCVCWRWFVVKVLRYTLFMKKKYFPVHSGLNALVLFELNVTERKQNKTGAGLS